MIGSDDSVDFFPELPVISEQPSIPLQTCWGEEICLSDIWIPSKLLPSRKKNSRMAKGIFNTLEQRDSAQRIPSFSCYSSSDEEEIFQSDSDSDFLCLDEKISQKHENAPESSLAADSGNSFKDLCDIVNDCGSEGKFKSLNCQTFNQKEKQTGSQISLNENLDNTPEIDINFFKTDCSKRNAFLGIQGKKAEPVQQKKKAEAKKSIALEKIFKYCDKVCQDYQDACCNAFFNKLLVNKHKDGNAQLRNTAEFINISSCNHPTSGKIVIENIPRKNRKL